ncbi:DUF2521 family protein [Anaerobacillus sp. MEB173]|uniref:DUF2521 family protein n=1 Tax=Anaerobacillus sp. MEB173 TaxID=3383345 RepID=UPI003F8FD7A1
MTVITTFFDKQRKKQWMFERKVLRKLSLVAIRNKTREHFESLFSPQLTNHPFIEDFCIDLAIDAYLVGAEYSRFGYYGEAIGKVKRRSSQKIKDITDKLTEFLSLYCDENDLIMESISSACETFIIHWWEQGFKEGEMRYRMRLH